MLLISEKGNNDANLFLIMRKLVTSLVPIFQYIIFNIRMQTSTKQEP